MNVRGVWDARRAFAIYACGLYVGKNLLFDAITHLRHPCVAASLQRFPGQFRRLAERDNSGNILRARAPGFFVTSAIQHGVKDGSLSHVERADSLGRVHLVPGDRKQIAPETVYIDWDLPGCLYRVGVEIYLCFGSNLADLFDR